MTHLVPVYSVWFGFCFNEYHTSPPPGKTKHQLYETTLVRHGIMLVGPTGGGKTKIFRCLRTALDKTTGITHKDSRFNPKAIRAQEMYGEVDPATGEWNTGKTGYFVLSSCVFPFPRVCLLHPAYMYTKHHFRMRTLLPSRFFPELLHFRIQQRDTNRTYVCVLRVVRVWAICAHWPESSRKKYRRRSLYRH